MVVISDFKDYYDCAQAYGQDKSLVYKRFQKVMELDQDSINSSWEFILKQSGNKKAITFPTYYQSEWLIKSDFLKVKQFTIGFCGKIYGLLIIEKNTHSSEIKSKFCYNIEDVDKFVKDNFKNRFYQSFCQKEYNRKNPWPSGQRKYAFEKYFKSVEECKDKYLDLFVNEHCPIFVAQYKFDKNANAKRTYFGRHYTEITFNAKLKDYEFFRIFDPYQAFQEISMFMGNQAEPRKEIPQLSNSDLIESKGFHLKESFRKPKQI